MGTTQRISSVIGREREKLTMTSINGCNIGVEEIVNTVQRIRGVGEV